jgi:hypothetical protein
MIGDRHKRLGAMGMAARSLVGALAVVSSAGCHQSADALGSRPMTREAAYGRQVDLDVAAIIVGMALAHGAQVVALKPERQQGPSPIH